VDENGVSESGECAEDRRVLKQQAMPSEKPPSVDVWEQCNG